MGGDKSPFEMRFVSRPQSPMLFLKPGYVKTKRQDKLRPKAFPSFLIGSLALLNSGSVVHSRNVTWLGYFLQSLFLQRMCVL